MQVNSDWDMQGTASSLVADIGDFEFKGPGIYARDNEFDLVLPDVPRERFSWKQTWPEDTRFRFYHFGVPFSDHVFSHMGSIPTRQDERG